METSPEPTGLQDTLEKQNNSRVLKAIGDLPKSFGILKVLLLVPGCGIMNKSGQCPRKKRKSGTYFGGWSACCASATTLLMLGELKPGYTSLLLQNMAGRPGGGVGKGCDHGVMTREGHREESFHLSRCVAALFGTLQAWKENKSDQSFSTVLFLTFFFFIIRDNSALKLRNPSPFRRNLNPSVRKIGRLITQDRAFHAL